MRSILGLLVVLLTGATSCTQRTQATQEIQLAHTMSTAPLTIREPTVVEERVALKKTLIIVQAMGLNAVQTDTLQKIVTAWVVEEVVMDVDHANAVRAGMPDYTNYTMNRTFLNKYYRDRIKKAFPGRESLYDAYEYDVLHGLKERAK